MKKNRGQLAIGVLVTIGLFAVSAISGSYVLTFTKAEETNEKVGQLAERVASNETFIETFRETSRVMEQFNANAPALLKLLEKEKGVSYQP